MGNTFLVGLLIEMKNYLLVPVLISHHYGIETIPRLPSDNMFHAYPLCLYRELLQIVM
jgi:hypothetical protein